MPGVCNHRNYKSAFARHGIGTSTQLPTGREKMLRENISSDYLHFSPRNLLVQQWRPPGSWSNILGSFFAGIGTHDQLRVDKKISEKKFESES